jgi:hypothetical protein
MHSQSALILSYAESIGDVNEQFASGPSRDNVNLGLGDALGREGVFFVDGELSN